MVVFRSESNSDRVSGVRQIDLFWIFVRFESIRLFDLGIPLKPFIVNTRRRPPRLPFKMRENKRHSNVARKAPYDNYVQQLLLHRFINIYKNICVYTYRLHTNQMHGFPRFDGEPDAFVKILVRRTYLSCIVLVFL